MRISRSFHHSGIQPQVVSVQVMFYD